MNNTTTMRLGPGDGTGPFLLVTGDEIARADLESDIMLDRDTLRCDPWCETTPEGDLHVVFQDVPSGRAMGKLIGALEGLARVHGAVFHSYE